MPPCLFCVYTYGEMMTVRMKQLPKMARGEGTMAYREDGTIMFRKMVKVSETQTKRVTVYGETVREVMALMAQKEKRSAV